MIDTFLFDMGNVLVYFSHPQMCRQIADVCGCSAEEIRSLMFDRGWEGEIERGQITDAELQQRLETYFHRPLSLPELVHAASDIFTLNTPMLSIVRSLKRQHKRLVLLSNTSFAHIEFVRREFEILNDFDELVLSCAVGAMKPEAAIYQAALAKIQCHPERCFYTDDIEPYVLEGRRFGLQAEVFTTAESLIEQLASRGIQVDASPL